MMENDEITRRDFVSMTVGAGIVAATAAEVSAQQRVVETNVEIKTAHGTRDAAFIHPATGSHPAVGIWPDASRPTLLMRDMAKRLAAAGYSVPWLNPGFIRVAKAPVVEKPSSFNFNDPGQRGQIDAAHGLDQFGGRG